MATPYDTHSVPKDPITGTYGRVGERGDTRVAQRMLLLSDDFETNTLDTNRWIAVSGSSGSQATGNQITTFNTNTNAAGNAAMDSQLRMAPIIGTELYVRFVARFGTDAVADCTRYFGLRDDAETTQIYLELDDSTLAVKVDDAESNDKNQSVTQINPDDNTFFEFEIYYSKSAIRTLINGEIVGNWSIVGRTTPFIDTGPMRAFAKVVNSGSTTNSTLILAEVCAYLIGDVASGPCRCINRDSAADAQIMRGPGILERWETGEAALAPQVFRLYDGVSTSGRLLTKTYGGVFSQTGPWYFADGLWMDHISGTADDIFFHVRG